MDMKTVKEIEPIKKQKYEADAKATLIEVKPNTKQIKNICNYLNHVPSLKLTSFLLELLPHLRNPRVPILPHPVHVIGFEGAGAVVEVAPVHFRVEVH